jgi:hypothetical protein
MAIPQLHQVAMPIDWPSDWAPRLIRPMVELESE